MWECERGWALFSHQSRRITVSLLPGEYALQALDAPNDFRLGAAGGRCTVTGTLPARGVLLIVKR
jgi:ferric-dicitrate binding protein FerR (iron transport regulator)